MNSLHGQGIDTLADSLRVEAITPDGVVEGVRLRNDRTFTVGVQWHAEWKPEEHELSRRLFEEFGRAAHARARLRPHPDLKARGRVARTGTEPAGASAGVSRTG